VRELAAGKADLAGIESEEESDDLVHDGIFDLVGGGAVGNNEVQKHEVREGVERRI